VNGNLWVPGLGRYHRRLRNRIGYSRPRDDGYGNPLDLLAPGALADGNDVFGGDRIRILTGRSECVPGFGHSRSHLIASLAEGSPDLMASLGQCRFCFGERPGQLFASAGWIMPRFVTVSRMQSGPVRRLWTVEPHPRVLVPHASDDPECHDDHQDEENDAFHISPIP
jgi:hypothetical protein